jgi:hypothetical protein
MITVKKLTSLDKTEIPDVSKTLDPEDIKQLVNWLEEKDDTIRYHSLLLLQNRSQIQDDVYPFWDVFAEKLSNTNSYQRSIGLMLLADNVRWDTPGRFDNIVNTFLALCDDEKPVTVRQCIQSLVKIVPCKKHLAGKIADKLLSIDLAERKETQQKILLLDILSVLAVLRKVETSESLERYIFNALTGEILDKKAKTGVEKLLAA